jgi:hypothetical protein
MFKIIRTGILIILSGFLFFSCVKKTTRKETEESLKTAMDLYLNHQPKIDTSKVKFNVLEVIYFEDKSIYICNFKVHMKARNNDQIIDTTGAMRARISKDFRTVSRTY